MIVVTMRRQRKNRWSYRVRARQGSTRADQLQAQDPSQKKKQRRRDAHTRRTQHSEAQRTRLNLARGMIIRDAVEGLGGVPEWENQGSNWPGWRARGGEETKGVVGWGLQGWGVVLWVWSVGLLVVRLSEVLREAVRISTVDPRLMGQRPSIKCIKNRQRLLVS